MGNGCSFSPEDTVEEESRESAEHETETPFSEPANATQKGNLRYLTNSSSNNHSLTFGPRTPPPAVRIPDVNEHSKTMVSTAYSTRPYSGNNSTFDSQLSPSGWGRINPPSSIPPLPLGSSPIPLAYSPTQNPLGDVQNQSGSILLRNSSVRTSGSATSFRQGGFRKSTLSLDEDEDECADRVAALMRKMSKNQGSRSSLTSLNSSNGSFADITNNDYLNPGPLYGGGSGDASLGPTTPRRDLNASVDMTLAAMSDASNQTNGHRRGRTSVNFVS